MKPMLDMTVPEILEEIRERTSRPTVSRAHWTTARLMAEVLPPLLAMVELRDHPPAVACSRKEMEDASYKADSLRGLNP